MFGRLPDGVAGPEVGVGQLLVVGGVNVPVSTDTQHTSKNQLVFSFDVRDADPVAFSGSRHITVHQLIHRLRPGKQS